MTKKYISRFLAFFKYLLIFFGSIFLLSLILSFTTAPFWAYYWLGTSKSELKSPPESIVMLGGSGMPGKSNLMRCWFTAKAYHSFPGTKVIVAMPGDTLDQSSTPRLMKKELVLRGIPDSLLVFEASGTNTRAQALNCAEILPLHQNVMLVTSPEHMRRSVLCFQKTGFEKVSALPAFETDIEADLTFDDDELGEDKLLLPDVGGSISLRYQVWSHLKYEIMVAREMMALGYYKLRGWI